MSFSTNHAIVLAAIIVSGCMLAIQLFAPQSSMHQPVEKLDLHSRDVQVLQESYVSKDDYQALLKLVKSREAEQDAHAKIVSELQQQLVQLQQAQAVKQANPDEEQDETGDEQEQDEQEPLEFEPAPPAEPEAAAKVEAQADKADHSHSDNGHSDRHMDEATRAKVFGVHGLTDWDADNEIRRLDKSELDEKDLISRVRCLGPAFNRSCEFTNLFKDRQGYFTLHLESSMAEIFRNRHSYSVSLDGKYGHGWSPTQRVYDDIEKLKASITKPVIDYKGYGLYFHTMWASNVGHGLWDGLYPAFISLIRFNRHLKPLRLMPSLPEDDGRVCAPPANTKGCQCREIIKKFGRRGMLRLKDMDRLVQSGHVLHFEKVIVGSNHMAQRILQADLTLPGAREYDSVSLYRKQMFWAHDVPLPPYRPKRPKSELSAIVIDNRRYSKEEKAMFETAIEQLGKEGLKVEYINYKDFFPFAEQLKLLARTDIYISGPGTGMMLQPFMADGSVMINLQDIFKRYGMAHVSAEEEYVTESTSYMRGLYYDSHIRMDGLQLQEFLRVTREAFELVHAGFDMPVKPRSNLSPEGIVFVEACDMAPVACQQMLNEMNAITPPWQCVTDGWASFAVYEIGGYEQGFIPPGPRKNASCTMPRTEIRQLRQKYAHKLGQTKRLHQHRPVTIPKPPALAPGEDLGPLPADRAGRMVYFVHVHMAGGTWFCLAAKSLEQTLPKPNWNCNGNGDAPGYNNAGHGINNNNWTCSERAAYMKEQSVQFFAVETMFHLGDLACKQDFYFAIVLRHPIERLMEHIGFESQFWPEDWDVVKAWMVTSTVEEGKTKRGSPVVDNYLVRTLLGEPTFSLPLGTLTDDHLAQAKDVLRQMVVFSDVHLHTQSATVASCYFQWQGVKSKQPFHYSKDGVRVYLQRFGDEGIANLTKMNRLDMELYAFGLKRAEQQYKACLESKK
eukprot:TRINITY_DN12524_c0_g4_i10.p1 TRINITY_DN12524_c0_g4~~TRINITY_DN12524_c0_g4_i10.p1  ORF type:complete len:955 (+),score=276.38 TRINITY_DN12524_c0_g4_i10:123-2987(+)